MGIEIGVIAPRKKLELQRTYLKFTCDSKNHKGFVKTVVSQRWELKFFEWNFRAAMKAGWKETFRNGRRVFLCPGCSGK